MMNRRRFIRQTATIGAAAILAPGLASAETLRDPKKKSESRLWVVFSGGIALHIADLDGWNVHEQTPLPSLGPVESFKPLNYTGMDPQRHRTLAKYALEQNGFDPGSGKIFSNQSGGLAEDLALIQSIPQWIEKQAHLALILSSTEAAHSSLKRYKLSLEAVGKALGSAFQACGARPGITLISPMGRNRTPNAMGGLDHHHPDCLKEGWLATFA
ncbi:MAG: hypothetical protein ACO3AF_00670 [Flavobacteriales bacterium]